MKKCFLLFSLIFLSSLLYAQVYKSNILGQQLEESSFDNIGFYISKEGNASILYLDGEVYSRTTDVVTDEGIRIVTEHRRDDTVIERQYHDGLLISEETRGKGSFEKRIYTYVNGALSFCSICIDNGTEVWDVVYYIRSQVDGSLIGVKRNNVILIVDDDYIIDNGSLLQEVSNNLFIDVDFEVDEKGKVSFTENGVHYEYSSEGKLISKAENGYKTFYEYSGEDLLAATTENGDETVIDEYDHNSLKRRVVYIDGMISSETIFGTSGMGKTIYSNGKPFVKVLYKEDNRQVESIEYYGD